MSQPTPGPCICSKGYGGTSYGAPVFCNLHAQAPALREALEKLLAELSSVQVTAVREGCGNTNAAVLQLRIDEARALLKETP